MDETYIKIKGVWKHWYRAVDSQGNRLDFTLNAKQDRKAATRLFRRVLQASHTQAPCVRRCASFKELTVDKNAAAYPIVIKTLKADEMLAAETELRQSKYLNNVIEQNHRNIKRVVMMMCF